MDVITVRQAVMADLPELATLFDAYRQFQGQASDVPAARRFLQQRFDHGESVVFVCHDGDQPLGFAQLYPIYSSVSMSRVFVLNDLFVQAHGRRKGVAARLLSAVEAYAWSLGAARISLNVARDNLSAQELYRSQGWQQDGQYFMFHRFPQA